MKNSSRLIILHRASSQFNTALIRPVSVFICHYSRQPERHTGAPRDHPSTCDTNEPQTAPCVLWQDFFIGHLAPFPCAAFIWHLTFTCRSCCFPLEQSRSHSTPVRNLNFIAVLSYLLKPPDVPCLGCKNPEESSTYISKKCYHQPRNHCVYANKHPPLDCGGEKKKSRRVYFMALMCVVPGVTGTFTRHMKFAPKC